MSAQKRTRAIKKFEIADKVIVGDKGNIFDILKKERARIVVLGHDQKDVPEDVKNKYKLKVYRASKL
ncbi:MAG: hypothetical protein HY831_03280 [Candidatus Aenigmarchaeota archaeon]|nr:hypothetical protein [Candidatus Aenigmarchaeota archaeon]